MNSINRLFWKITTPAVLALHGLSALAQTIPDVAPSTITDKTGLENKITSILNSVIGLLGIVVVVLIVYAGFLYVTAGTNEDNTKKAKSIFTYAMIGLVIAVLSYTIVNVAVSFIGG